MRTALLLVGAHLAFAVTLFLVFGFHSYHPTDHGFVLGAAWRVAQGEVPYRDFLWLRPPGTPVLHSLALVLPESWSLLATRLAYYLEMSGAALLPALWAVASRAARPPLVALLASIACLSIALHNFPAMAWYTVDGVFAGSAGLAALCASISSEAARRRLLWRSVASLLLFGAALFKQPYASLAAALALWAILEVSSRARERGHAMRLLAATLVPGVALWIAVIAGLAAAGALPDALDQLGRAASARDLWHTGVLVYLKPAALLPLALGAGTAFVALFRPRLPSGLRRALAAGVLAFALWLGLIPGEAGHPLFQLLLGALLVRAFAWLRSGDRMGRSDDARRARSLLVYHAGLLLLAWSASISWSQQTPLLGLVGAAPALCDLLPRAKRDSVRLAAMALVAAVAVGAMLFSNWQHPYRDAPLPRQTAALHEILPRFGHLYTHPGHAERFAELVSLIERHATNPERPFTVLRSFPAIHFLTGRKPPTRLDWYLKLEVRGFERELREELLTFEGIVFFQREGYVGRQPLRLQPDRRCTARELDHSPELLAPVFRAGRLLESTRAFCVVKLGR
jgi:hypothetical protein